ncbi:MAG: hypothetical protein K2O69_04700 [Odoribacter sp.]|nr:hypothetical protein [Odoribacter sp.]
MRHCFTACSKDDDDKDPLNGEGEEGVITMVTKKNRIMLYVDSFKEGETITIDWGDGTIEEFKTYANTSNYSDYWTDYLEHSYSNNNPHTIKIKGSIKALNSNNNDLTLLDVSRCTALTRLWCYSNNLTSLDVSKNTALTLLNCNNNNLTSLDVSKNTALTEELVCSYNNLSATVLNKIFNDLPQGKYDEYGLPARIHIYYNPGSETCDTSIAENKGWTVY